MIIGGIYAGHDYPYAGIRLWYRICIMVAYGNALFVHCSLVKHISYMQKLFILLYISKNKTI